jgi:hypothetical protein
MGDVEMQVNFEVVGWWYAIEVEEGEEVLYRHDRLTLAEILHSVPPDMLSSLRDRSTSTAAAWEVIKQIRVEVQRAATEARFRCPVVEGGGEGRRFREPHHQACCQSVNSQ